MIRVYFYLISVDPGDAVTYYYYNNIINVYIPGLSNVRKCNLKAAL